MKTINDSIKNYLFIFFVFSLFPINAQENKEDLALQHLDALVAEIKQSLGSHTLTPPERDQIYDIVGSLGLCRPVVQTVLEQSVAQMPSSPVVTPDLAPPNSAQDQHPQGPGPTHSPGTPPDNTVAQQISAFNIILSKFDALKIHIIQQLTDHKIDSAHHESAYTLIGSINLCYPILKGADILLDKMKTVPSVSKDQPHSTPAPEHLTTPNSSTSSLNASTPMTS